MESDAQSVTDTHFEIPSDIQQLSRDELIDAIMWNSGGYGYGVCSFANMMAHRLSTVEPKSVIAVCAETPDEIEKYTDEELRKLAAFSRECTDAYRSYFGTCAGVNYIIFDKLIGWRKDQPEVWLRKRASWEVGTMHSLSLDEAIAHMRSSVSW